MKNLYVLLSVLFLALAYALVSYPSGVLAACSYRSPNFDYVPIFQNAYGLAPLAVTAVWDKNWSFSPYTMNGVYYPAPTYYINWGDGSAVEQMPHEECVTPEGQHYRNWPAQEKYHTYNVTGTYCPFITHDPSEPLRSSCFGIGAVEVVDPPSLLTLTVLKRGTGTGVVTSSIHGLNCGSTCSVTYSSDDSRNIALTATPDTGSVFKGWSYESGVFLSTSTTYVLPVSILGNVVAEFSKLATPTAPLTVVKNGTGAGTVTSAPVGIQCGSVCTRDFSQGSMVTLTATPNSSSTFVGWSGHCAGTSTCTVTMSAARSVTATFNVKASKYMLTVNKLGTGLGLIQSNPGGVYCGGSARTCSGEYAANSSVTLFAYSSGDGRFLGWGGGCTGTTTSCTVTMNAARTVTANFTKNTINGCPPGSSLSGTSWVSQFPTSYSLTALNAATGFRQNASNFVSALRNAGATVSIAATYRPPQRAYLMHYAFQISKGNIDPRNVPMGTGVSICWVHKDAGGAVNLSKSRSAAQQMVNAYGITSTVAPSLTSYHITGNAIDMSISWAGALNIKNASGANVSITTLPATGMNQKLWQVGATYKVVKYGNYPGGIPANDVPHWSIDGR